MKKILFIKGNSQYGTLRLYSDLRINEFKRLGYSVQVLDRAVEGQWENLHELIEEDVEIVISSQLVALKAMLRLREYPQFRKLCYICTLGDHPAMEDYWFKQIREDDNFYLWSFGVNEIKYLNQYYPNVKTILGDAPLSAWGLVDDIKEYELREYEVYFGGSSFNMESCLQKIESELEKEDSTIAKSIIDMFLNKKIPLDISIEDALTIYLDTNHITMDHVSFRSLRARLQVLEFFARGYYRYKCIEVLVKSGIKVHVYGNGWESSKLLQYDNFILLEDKTPTLEKGMEYMNNSKIVLNVSRNDIHDRHMNTMMVGALCCTTATNITREYYSEDEAVMFGADEIDKLPEIIGYYLDRPELSKKIAQNGFHKTMRDNSVAKVMDEFIICCRMKGIDI